MGEYTRFTQLPESWKIHNNVGQTQKPIQRFFAIPDKKNFPRYEVKAHSPASETDEVFEALEMAEGVGKKLEAVLKKLNAAWARCTQH